MSREGGSGDQVVVRRVVRRRRVEHVNPKDKAKSRADELQASGMPFQMAMAVAHGRITLNEALERMARSERVEKMMRDHELSRALATQIALGQASLEKVLSKRRLAQHREDFRDRSILSDAVESGEVVTLQLTKGRRVEAHIERVDAYTFQMRETGSDSAVEVHKLEVKFGYAPDDWKKLRKGLKKDKAVAADAAAPSTRPQDRYSCSDKRLFRYMDNAELVTATLLEGEILKGTIRWFGRYEFGLDISGAEVVVFRHALHDLRSNKGK